MVCYARPATLLAAIVAVAWLVFGGPVSHFFSTAAVVVAVLVAAASAAVAAVLVFATFMSTRRRRAGAGGCVNCQFRCQHAMTGQRLWLVTTADRGEPARPACPKRSPSPGGKAAPSATSTPDRFGGQFA